MASHEHIGSALIHEKPRASDLQSSGNILLVGNWRSDAGYSWKMIERFWIAIARAFPSRRTILCFPQVTTVNPDILSAGIEVKQFDFDLRRPAALARFCRHHDIGLAYLTDRPYSSSTYPVLRSVGVRKILVHDHSPGQRTEPSPLKRVAKTAKVRMFGADAYIACSEQVLERFTKVGCIHPGRCHLALNGIELSRFPHPRPTIRKELLLSPDTLLAVSCSRVHTYKRVSDIVDAAALLTDLDVRFIHIGDGPGFEALQMKIEELGLQSRFTLLGQRDDVAEILSGCDIAIHASSGEVGLSLSILEFMASQLALVVTDEPTVSRIIDSGRTGLTFPHGDAQALAARLRELSSDSHMRLRLGKAAREYVENGYRVENTVASVLGVVEKVYAESNGPHR